MSGEHNEVGQRTPDIQVILLITVIIIIPVILVVIPVNLVLLVIPVIPVILVLPVIIRLSLHFSRPTHCLNYLYASSIQKV